MNSIHHNEGIYENSENLSKVTPVYGTPYFVNADTNIPFIVYNSCTVWDIPFNIPNIVIFKICMCSCHGLYHVHTQHETLSGFIVVDDELIDQKQVGGVTKPIDLKMFTKVFKRAQKKALLYRIMTVVASLFRLKIVTSMGGNPGGDITILMLYDYSFKCDPFFNVSSLNFEVGKKCRSPPHAHQLFPDLHNFRGWWTPPPPPMVQFGFPPMVTSLNKLED